MLTITVFQTEAFDDSTQEFVGVDGVELSFEHSLVSLSKWEEKYEKPFLGKESKTSEEILDYISMMNLTPNVPPEVFQKLSKENAEEINAYLNATRTATTFHDKPGAPTTQQTITSEVIYYWLVAFKIPWEAQYWHLNRLFALVRVCNIKQQDPKKNKMSKAEIAARNRELNAQRRRELNTAG